MPPVLTPVRDDLLWYAWLPLPEAAADPATPEDYLLRAGCRDAETFFALASRPQHSPEMTGWLTLLATGGDALADFGQRNRAVTAVLGVDGLTAWHVDKLAEAITELVPGSTEAFVALLDHPACSTEAVGRVLLHFRVIGTGYAELASAAAARGSPVPAAIALTPWSREPFSRHLTAVLATAAELEAACVATPGLRQPVAALGADWRGDLPSLLTVAAAVRG